MPDLQNRQMEYEVRRRWWYLEKAQPRQKNEAQLQKMTQKKEGEGASQHHNMTSNQIDTKQPAYNIPDNQQYNNTATWWNKKKTAEKPAQQP